MARSISRRHAALRRRFSRWPASLRAGLLAVFIGGLIAGGIATNRDDPLSAVDGANAANAAPTVPGAPFLPIADRAEHVATRNDALNALAELDRAQQALLRRADEVRTAELAAAVPPSLSGQVLAEAVTAPDDAAADDVTDGALGDDGGPPGSAGALDEASPVAAAVLPRRAPVVQDEELLTELGIAETLRIIDAEVESLERTLSELKAQEDALLEETAPWGIGLAVFPVDEIRKPFWNDWGRPRSGGRTHVGNDILAQIGVPLRAIEDGVVQSLSSGGLGGNGIFLLGDSGSRYYYAHMHELEDLQPGDRVLAGQQVGSVGDTGNAAGAPHLHMQWDPDGGSNWQNPFPLLDVLFGAGRTEQFDIAADQLLAAEAEAARVAAEAAVLQQEAQAEADRLARAAAEAAALAEATARAQAEALARSAQATSLATTAPSTSAQPVVPTPLPSVEAATELVAVEPAS